VICGRKRPVSSPRGVRSTRPGRFQGWLERRRSRRDLRALTGRVSAGCQQSSLPRCFRRILLCPLAACRARFMQMLELAGASRLASLCVAVALASIESAHVQNCPGAPRESSDKGIQQHTNTLQALHTQELEVW